MQTSWTGKKTPLSTDQLVWYQTYHIWTVINLRLQYMAGLPREGGVTLSDLIDFYIIGCEITRISGIWKGLVHIWFIILVILKLVQERVRWPAPKEMICISSDAKFQGDMRSEEGSFIFGLMLLLEPIWWLFPKMAWQKLNRMWHIIYCQGLFFM
jgi:hypothetical protein